MKFVMTVVKTGKAALKTAKGFKEIGIVYPTLQVLHNASYAETENEK